MIPVIRLFIWVWLLWVLRAQAAIEYQLIDLGPLTDARAISDVGTVVGTAVDQGNVTAAVLSPTPTLIHPGYATATAGQEVVGSGSFGPFGLQGHAFTWNPTQGLRDLGTLREAFLLSAATGVNQTLTISGYGDAPGTVPQTPGPIVPVYWVNGVIQQLPILDGGTAVAQAINLDGDMAGDAGTADGHTHMVLWPIEGGIVDCDAGQARHSFGLALNRQRTIVGFANYGAFHAASCTITEGVRDLGVLPGDEASRATSINDLGTIVGWSTPPSSCCQRLPSHATRWDAHGLIDLNTRVDAPGWILTNAFGINNAGVIVGFGTVGGVTHSWMLQPVTPAIPVPPVELFVEVRGDFNGDGVEDLAGLTLHTEIYRCLAGDAACEMVPGRAIELAACDGDHDGRDELVALASDTRIFVLTGDHWRQVPGRLRHLVARHLRNGACELAGVAWDTTLWRSDTGGETWNQFPGRLRSIIAGDFVGGADDQLAGVGNDTSLWYYRDTWRQLPGWLVTLETIPGTPDGMRGRAYDGVWWEARTLGNWRQLP